MRRPFSQLLWLGLITLLLAGSALAQELRVGVYENEPKVFTGADGKPTGILIDLLQEMAAVEGWQLRFVPCEWQACLNRLAAGDLDLMPDVAWSAQRQSQFAFHQTPALYSWSQLYTRKAGSLLAPTDLQGKRIAVLDGGIQLDGLHAMLQAFGVKAEVQTLDSLPAVFARVQNGQADAAAAGHYFGDFHAHGFDLVESPIVFQPTRLFYAAALGRQSNALAAIDRHLDAWRQDEASPYFKVLKRWGADVQDDVIPTKLRNALALALAILGLALVLILALRWQVKRRTRELAQQNTKLARMTQLYAALSQCNQAIVRCADEAALFAQICCDAVNFGGMRMAWIGMLNATGNQVQPVASFGSGVTYLQGIDISVSADEPSGRGPTGTAMREDHPVWCQDFQHDPMTALWRARASGYGWAASAALPLHRQGKVVGVLTLYADTVGAFDEPAQNLLIEMAMDISFALDRFDDAAQRQCADLKIRQQSEKLAALLRISQELAGKTDLQAVLEIATARIAQIANLTSSAIYLCQDSAHLFLGATTPALPPDFPAQLRVVALADHPHIQRALDSRQASILPDAQTAELTPAEAEAVRLRALRTLLYLPLLAEGELLGVLIVASTERAVTLQPGEVELCHTLANLTALAVKNAQLFDAVQLSKNALQLQAHRAEALLALPAQAQTLPERDFMAYAAELAEQLTDSCIAFIHLVHDDQLTIELGSWSRSTKMNYCKAAYDNHYPIDNAGVWADALRQRAPVVINDYASAPGKHGLPEGHAHLQRLISVPVIEGGLVRMMVGVGNKAGDYTALDVETVQLIANASWHIVEQRRSAAALRASEQELSATFEQAAIGMAQSTLDTKFRKLNKKLTDLLGYTETELLGKSFMDITHPDDVQDNQSQLQDLLNGKLDQFSMEKRYLHKSGAVVWGNATVGIVRRPDGSPGYFVAMVEDISAKKQSEDALRKLSQAVEQSPSSIVITDLDANIVYANTTFSQITGYALGEVMGRNPRILHSGKTPQSTYADMWAHLTRGERWEGEFINKRQDGTEYIELARLSPVRDAQGVVTNYLAIKDDITAQKQAAARIEHLAHFDQLTGLPNRVLLQDRFHLMLTMAQRKHESLALMYLDLDHFKTINDTLGHNVGDRLLAEVARRLVAAVREVDVVSRQGGDEFILILPGVDAKGAATLAAKLIDVVAEPFIFEMHELATTTSIGIALFPQDGSDEQTLSSHADAAMYQAKQAGRNSFRFYTQTMQRDSARHLRLATDLRHALARNALFLLYQPQVAMQDGRVLGAEALLRWQHPELGLISPAEFIPVAENSGLIIPIGEWVLRTAAMQAKAWIDAGQTGFVMAVNLSAVQFRDANLFTRVCAILAETGLSPNALELELTEAMAMDDPHGAMAVMQQFSDYGIRLSIDDFGTGYSSLSYLKRFKVYKLKIDQSFVRDISTDPDDKAIVTAIINMASSLGLHTIAEGVETAEQLAYLRLHGCDEVQGYYFSKPLTAQAFEAFVAQR